MSTLVFLLEEPSAREMLKAVVPQLLPPGIQVRYVPFEGKQDLHKQMVRKLRGWLVPDTRFIVLRDQDAEDCRVVKSELAGLCRTAGRPDALVRIACHELESFYLGDLAAVAAGLGVTGIAGKQAGRKFRAPDRLGNPSEELVKLTSGRYQKIAGSRAIGPRLCVDGSSRSRSFNVLIDGIRRVAAELAALPGT